MKNCPRCNAQNPLNSQFCNNCGLTLTQVTTQQSSIPTQNFPVTPPPPPGPAKKGITTPIALLIAFGGMVALCAVVGGIGALLDKGNRNTTTTSATTVPTATAQDKTLTSSTVPPTPAKPAVSAVTWKEYDAIFNVRSKTTDMQKEQAWKNYKDRRVLWTGEVQEVTKGSFGGITLGIKMNPDTLIRDLTIDLKKDQEARAGQLTKGQKISFEGTLTMYGGAILPTQMSDGEIK